MNNFLTNNDDFFVVDNKVYKSEKDIIKLIRSAINNEKIVIIKSFVSSGNTINLREKIYSWGSSIQNEPPQTFQNNTNYKVLENGISPYQKTLHYYQAYNFHDAPNLSFYNQLSEVFDPLINFFNNYRQSSLSLKDVNNNKSLRPQLLHFFKGGGFLASHIHQKEPQNIGLILMASQRFIDFKKCTIAFEKDDHIIDPGDLLEVGDLLVFNYGQRHWVTSCDIEEKMSYDNSGFWIFTLPYY